MDNIVQWSSGSSLFVQATNNKWYSDGCSVGVIKEGKLVGVVDLLDIATKDAYKFLAKKGDADYGKHKKDFAIMFDINHVNDDGLVELEVSGEIPKSEKGLDSI